jgi:hypothetical protein
MRTSLTRLELIESYISGSMPPAERAVFTAKLVLDKDLAAEVHDQTKTYNIIREYGREELRAEIELIHHELIRKKSFWDQIITIFEIK